MSLQDQINALVARQGATAVERDLLTSTVDSYDATGGGSGETFRVELASGTVAFHKTFSGVPISLAGCFGHTDPDQVPIHEAAAWRLAYELGDPFRALVCVCVLRTIDGEPGTLSRLVPGSPWRFDDGDTRGLGALAEQASAGAFFDSLIGQQDRHTGNLFSDGATLGLIDHGFAFALPGDLLNAAHLVAWRHAHGDPRLAPSERRSLDRLLRGDLLGLRVILHPDRATALADRARRMRATNRILRGGEF